MREGGGRENACGGPSRVFLGGSFALKHCTKLEPDSAPSTLHLAHRQSILMPFLERGRGERKQGSLFLRAHTLKSRPRAAREERGSD